MDKNIKAQVKSIVKEITEKRALLEKFQTGITEAAEKVVLLTEQIEEAENQRLEIVRQVARGEAAPEALDEARRAIKKLSDQRADFQDLAETYKAEVAATKQQVNDLRQTERSLKSKYYVARFEEYLDKNADQIAECYALFSIANKGQFLAPKPMMFLSYLERLQPDFFRPKPMEKRTDKLAKELQ